MIKSMDKIPHLSQMPVSFAKKFVGEGITYSATEKVDGSNVSICLIDGAIHLKTKKGKPTRNPQDFLDLADKFDSQINRDFARFLKDLLAVEAGLIKSFKEFKITQLFGELVPNTKPNVIEYDPHIVGEGVLYLFIKDRKDGIVNQLRFSLRFSWLVRGLQPVKVSTDVFDMFKTVHDWFGFYLDQLESRKRDEVSLNNKESAKKSYQIMLDDISRTILQDIKNEKSFLGDEMEGIVIENSDGMRVKVVDLDDFGERRKEKWGDVDEIKQMRADVKRTIIKDIFGGADILTSKNKLEQRMEEMISTSQNPRGITFNCIINTIIKDIRSEVEIDFSSMSLIAVEIYTDYYEKLLVKARTNTSGEAHSLLKLDVQNVCRLIDQLSHPFHRHDHLLITDLLGGRKKSELTKKYCR
jgi:hypothetical protein